MELGEVGLDPARRARVADYWWSRAHGEMTSWVGFGHVLDDLKQERAPAALISLAERAVNDEYQHALWCRDWAVRFGHSGGEVRPRSQSRLTFARASEQENRLLRIALCAFTETVGCVILRLIRPVLREPLLLYFCNTECDIAYGQANVSCYGAQDQLSAMCGCAVVFLK